MDKYIEAAFDAICTEAQRTDQWYVCLMVSVPFYGGPEEGGWWGEDSHCVKFQCFPTEDMAEQVKERDAVQQPTTQGHIRGLAYRWKESRQV